MLIGRGQPSPVLDVKRQVDTRMDVLNRRGEAVPVKAGSQAVMPGHHVFPRPTERADVQIVAWKIENRVVNVQALASIQQRVKQHSLLHRRQRVLILD